MWLRQEGTYGPNRPAGCNHWPVGQAACDGRTMQTADRSGHVLGFPISTPPVNETGDRSWWVGFYGMGQQSVEDLLEMAQGFNFPAELTLETDGYQNHGFDPGQRAWVVDNVGASDRALKLKLHADEKRPLYNPALVIRNAGDSPVQLKLNGKAVPFDADHRIGFRHHLEGTDLILWLKHSGTEPVHIEVIPIESGS